MQGKGSDMEFNVKRIESPALKKFQKDELGVAYEFSKKIYDEFGTFLKAVVLFGSLARGDQKKEGDVDVLVIVDDVSILLTQEIVETYRIILEKVISDTSLRLHVTSMKLTTFWEYVKNGDPVAFNMLREGYALLDTGFFDPLQALLYSGRIRPTPESMWASFSRAPKTLHNANWHVLQAVLDLYWAVVDAAHAALMKLGEAPPSPSHIADILEERMVKQKLLDKKYANTVRTFYSLQKGIMYRQIREISGPDYQRYFKEAEEFVNRMEEFIKRK